MSEIYIIDGDIMSDLKGNEAQFEATRMMGMAVKASQPIIAYCTTMQPMNEWLSYMMAHGITPDNGRKNALNVLCGVNRIIYHVTYRNGAGIPTRMFLLNNLLRTTSAKKLQAAYGGNTPMQAAIRALRSCDAMGISGMTIAGSAMNDYIGPHGNGLFAKNYPDLGTKVEYDMRTGYLGGYMECMPGDYENVTDYDCNSMYPTMLRNNLMPYGEPVEYYGEYEPDADMPLHIDVMTFRADLKPDGYAFLGVTDMLSGKRTGRVESTRGYITMALTNIDQRLLYDNYEVSVYEHKRGWKFAANTDNFTDYIDRWFALKSVSTGARRNIAKLMLNSLIGKFGTTPRDAMLSPRYDADDGRVEWHVTPSDNAQTSRHYLPVAMFVTAYARQTLFGVCRQNGNIVSINTDGFMIVNGEHAQGMERHPTKLGRWKTAAHYRFLRIIDVGMYQGERDNGDIDLVCAGVTRSTPIPWEQFRHGGSFVDDYGSEIVIQ